MSKPRIQSFTQLLKNSAHIYEEKKLRALFNRSLAWLMLKIRQKGLNFSQIAYEWLIDWSIWCQKQRCKKGVRAFGFINKLKKKTKAQGCLVKWKLNACYVSSPCVDSVDDVKLPMHYCDWTRNTPLLWRTVCSVSIHLHHTAPSAKWSCRLKRQAHGSPLFIITATTHTSTVS